ncbi:hypothetical protein CPB84DRAFT_1749887 [Gymnopilus junonius]|uniref:Uncharacterized protein n=1 Tax=Gymnopilus junonius TaxID=109634 RepID=A0A9P5NF24_GYMJU|nr:hypothetical protein CPB84DRAFT_1749887 [Gymnopilus junonius]
MLVLQNRKGKKKEHTAVSKAGQQQWRVRHITPCTCQCGADNQTSIHDAVIDARRDEKHEDEERERPWRRHAQNGGGSGGLPSSDQPVDGLGGVHVSAEGGGGVQVGMVEVSRWKEEAEGGGDKGESILQNE